MLENRSPMEKAGKYKITKWKISSCKLRNILNSMHDAIIAVNHEDRIVLFNTGAERLLGMPAEKMYGQYAKDTIPGSRLHCIMETGVAELNQRQKLGETCIITNRAPVRDENNQIVGAVAVFRDMTEIRNLAEEMTCVKETKELFEAIIHNTQDVISVVDDQGKIIMVNPEYTRVIGMNKEEVLGKPPTVDIRQGESVHLTVMKTLKPIRGVPLRVGPANREVVINAAPIIVDGQLRGSVVVARDISEIKLLAEELTQVRSIINHQLARYTFGDIVASGTAMKLAVENAQRAAITPVTVLLSGESGTGKELFAHAIHNASHRKNRPFVRVNCAAVPETLLESEFFGYDAGAFSGALKGGKRGLFEEANGGTLFLDEIGEIPSAMQVKLLRVLQEKEVMHVGSVTPVPVDVRIIAATNQDLEKAVRIGTFREDLYYRINAFPITIPPLRHRLGELLQLVRHLLIKLNWEYGRSVQGITEEAVAFLSHYHWPGNVRELENVLGRALINMRFNETTITAVHLPQLHEAAWPMLIGKKGVIGRPVCRSLAETVETAERNAIIAALAEHGGNRAETAQHLDISLRCLYYKLEKHGITH